MQLRTSSSIGSLSPSLWAVVLEQQADYRVALSRSRPAAPRETAGKQALHTLPGTTAQAGARVVESLGHYHPRASAPVPGTTPHYAALLLTTTPHRAPNSVQEVFQLGRNYTPEACRTLLPCSQELKLHSPLPSPAPSRQPDMASASTAVEQSSQAASAATALSPPPLKHEGCSPNPETLVGPSLI